MAPTKTETLIVLIAEKGYAPHDGLNHAVTQSTGTGEYRRRNKGSITLDTAKTGYNSVRFSSLVISPRVDAVGAKTYRKVDEAIAAVKALPTPRG